MDDRSSILIRLCTAAAGIKTSVPLGFPDLVAYPRCHVGLPYPRGSFAGGVGAPHGSGRGVGLPPRLRAR